MKTNTRKLLDRYGVCHKCGKRSAYAEINAGKYMNLCSSCLHKYLNILLENYGKISIELLDD